MRFGKSRAQGLIEFALLAPVFFIMFTGIVDFARAGWTYSSLAGAIREGGRNAILAPYGTSSSTDATILGQVQALGIGLSLSPAACIHGWSSAPVLHAPTTANTGWVYILAGSGGSANAPSGQASGSAGAGCVSHLPAPYGANPLRIEIVYNFQPVTPFASEFMGASGITMVVTSTMYTEF
jgi:hypothetical protein